MPTNGVRSWATSDGVRRSMMSNRGRDTAPELAVRRLVHRRGLRYKVDFQVMPSRRARADLAFTKVRIAVFIDGCFWHGCPEHATMPRANAEYWRPKLKRNIDRDRETDAALTTEGWEVLRFWEHEPPTEVADRIEQAVRVRAASLARAEVPFAGGPRKAVHNAANP